jgi:hypothetical protein
MDLTTGETANGEPWGGEGNVNVSRGADPWSSGTHQAAGSGNTRHFYKA